jgi:hypothetical protein
MVTVLRSQSGPGPCGMNFTQASVGVPMFGRMK